MVASCGSSGGGSNPDAAPLDLGGAQEAEGPPTPYCTSKPALAGMPDLSGTWVMRLTGSQAVSAPIVGIVHTKSVFYVLATLTQNGTNWVANGRYCDRVEMDPSTNIVQVIIPAPWAHTEKPVTRTGGKLALASDGNWVLTFPLLTEIAGAVLASDSDPLPTAADDPRVIDEDGDGHPGITVSLSGQSLSGNLYSVQKQMTSITAIAVAQDRVEGALAYSSLQNVLSSTPSSLAALYPQNQPPASDPILCNSGFAMVRIAGAGSVDGGAIDAATLDAGGSPDGGSVSCEWVRANEAVLF
jgi:hypothetical protein